MSVNTASYADLLVMITALKEENERLKAEKVQINGKLAGSRLAVSRLKARVAELTAPDVQGEPVATLLIGEPEYTKQGWEPGDWDIEPNATTIEAFAKLAKPGAYQLYLAPQPAPQPAEQPALAVAALVEALERARDRIESERRSGEWDPLLRDIDAALAAHRKHGGEV